MVSTRDAELVAVRAAAARVAESYGLELFDVQFRREANGWVLRVTLDRPAPDDGTPGRHDESVGIEDCRRVSEDLSALVDVEDEIARILDRPYTLEVSSPGLDRPLRGPADYRRFAGRLAKIVTREPVDGQSHFEGRLAGMDGDVVLLNEGRRTHRVPVGLISRARLDVEFGV